MATRLGGEGGGRRQLTLGMDDTLRDPLAIEMCQLLNQVRVLDEAERAPYRSLGKRGGGEGGEGVEGVCGTARWPARGGSERGNNAVQCSACCGSGQLKRPRGARGLCGWPQGASCSSCLRKDDDHSGGVWCWVAVAARTEEQDRMVRGEGRDRASDCACACYSRGAPSIPGRLGRHRDYPFLLPSPTTTLAAKPNQHPINAHGALRAGGEAVAIVAHGRAIGSGQARGGHVCDGQWIGAGRKSS